MYNRYNRQKAAYIHQNDIVGKHLNNLARLVGKAALSTLDNYIITMIETNDGRRALLDLKEIDNTTKEIEEQIVCNIEKEMDSIFTTVIDSFK